MSRGPLRFALLGAAQITPKAFIAPAAGLVTISGVASRSMARGSEFARAHGIAKVYGSYGEAIRDGDVEAIYIATPAAHHAEWARDALLQGKHVLCEKPFALGAHEAEELVDLASARGLILMEAHHSCFHPLWARFIDAVRVMPAVEKVEAVFDAPIPNERDIRLDPALGAGVFLDFGGYLLTWLTWVQRARGQADPFSMNILRAVPSVRPTNVDRTMTVEVELALPGQVPARLSCSMEPHVHFRAKIQVFGQGESVTWDNPLAVTGSKLTVSGSQSTVASPDSPSTYRGQLEAFVEAVRSGRSVAHSGRDIVALSRLVDCVYLQAGLAARYDLAHSEIAPTLN